MVHIWGEITDVLKSLVSPPNFVLYEPKPAKFYENLITFTDGTCTADENITIFIRNKISHQFSSWFLTRQ